MRREPSTIPFNNPLNSGVRLMSHLDSLKPFPGGMLNGQDLRQLLQSSPSSVQNLMQFSAFRYHFRAPGLFDTVGPSKLLSPELIALDGQLLAHISHTSQNSVNPKSTGPSGSRGMSVITFASASLGPYYGWTSKPFLPS